MKLFTGNLPWEATGQEARSLVEQCWKVLEYDSVKTCGFVHARTRQRLRAPHSTSATAGCMRVSIKVRASKDKSEASTKFEEYGPVIKHDDTVKDYAFVHMEWAEGAVEADRGLDSFQAKECMRSCLPAALD
ncbi:hypothetical protein MJG53_014152 [Ovis ammon polii x Ovis aries]|uniref:RRM domain-containing protein n=2 Tax=Ovis TaxID=9935 RepID=A0A836A506_SHEEP|nr:hypothetical protein JEQ12_004776 [Ovis aries]KAI4572046.1 hypothetical protein MJG53_014152 [Ovis ammon polii x Ovis aries]